MPWDDEDVKKILRNLDPVPILWLLIMSRESGQGVHVGTGKARNAVKLYSKVRSYAKNHGWNPPPDEKQVKQGYATLTRVPIHHPDLGTNTVIRGDKLDYLKLTSVGNRLVTRINTEKGLRKFAKGEAGLDVERVPDPDWPMEYDEEGASVILEPTSEYPRDQETFPIETKAKFECPTCQETICHKYSFTYPTEAWTKDVTEKCENCEEEWTHKVGDPHSRIT